MYNKHFYPKPKLKVKFSKEEIENLNNFFKKVKDLKTKTRCNGVLLRTKGYSISEITDILGKKTNTIIHWTRCFKKQGIAGLISKPQPGNNHTLSRQLKDKIKAEIKIKKPFQLNLLKTKAKFWNVPLLRTFVKKYYLLEYQSNRSYQRLFSYCGFSFHKPAGKDKRQNPQNVKRFQLKLKEKIHQIYEEEKRGLKIGSYWRPMKQD